MTIAEDTTNSPALVVGSGATVQTTAFTPPANCILVAHLFGDANTGAADESLTATDSLSGTWSTPILDNARGGAAVAMTWRAIGSSPASMQCQVVDNKGSVARAIFVRILTGTDLVNPFGATNKTGTASISITSTVANSWVWSAFLGSNATQTAGANTTQKANFGGFDSGDAISVFASTNTTATAGTVITLVESGGTAVHHVAVEIVPPSSGQSGAWAPAAGATATFAGGVTELGAWVPAAGASMAASGGVTVLPSWAPAAGAAAAFAATRVQPASWAPAAVASAVFGATRVQAVSVTATASAAMTISGGVSTFSSWSPAAGALFVASAGGVQSGAVTMAAGAAMTPAATRTVLPSVGFAAGAEFSLAGGVTVLPSVAMAAGAALAATGTRALAGALDLRAGAAFGATATTGGLAPLVRAVLVPGGALGAALAASGAAGAVLSPAGAPGATLTAQGATGATLTTGGSSGSTLIAGGV